MPDFSLFGEEHVRQYEETGGNIGHDWNNTSCLVLHTRGRRSGELRKFPLIYGRSRDDYIVVASKGGAAEHPGWYLNLLSGPDVAIQVRDQVVAVSARVASGEERELLWQVMLKEWPYYDKYQAKTDREIPVVVLTPKSIAEGVAG